MFTCLNLLTNEPLLNTSWQLESELAFSGA